MNKNNDFYWIKDDSLQLGWIVGYLSKRIVLNNIVTPYTAETIKQIKTDILAVKSGDSLELFLKKTRNAWNQYKRRCHMKSSHVTSSIELKKPVYRRVKKIAIKYNIPISLAIEELLINSCDFVEPNIHKEKQEKRQMLSRKAINERRHQKFEFINPENKINTPKPNELLTLLSKEMLERHKLELDMIRFITKDNNLKQDQLITKEKERYSNECEKLAVTCIYDA